jgi:hypothetical protein
VENQPAALGDSQLKVVTAIWDVFRPTGGWPVADSIDRLMDERWGLDTYAILRTLPASLVLFDRHVLREDTSLRLRVRAIGMCENSKDDLALFIRMVRWLAERERAFQPSSPHQVEQVRVRSEQLSADLEAEGRHVDGLALRKLWVLAEVERISWGGSFDIDGDPARWEMNLRRDIRPFRRVETLEDFLSVRDRLDEAAADEARRAYGVADVIAPDQPRVPTAPEDDRLYVFIAMPFGESWSEAVRALIEHACERVHSSGLRLRWERADEIDKPGHVTDQIVDAVSTADVVIADLTGANANVVYEIAYAEANRVPVIALNQDPSASPFDLKDLRQIAYTVQEIDAARGKLSRQLTEALGGAAE